MKYKILGSRIKLIGSHEIPKGKYGRELQAIRNLHPALPLWQTRTERSMKLEWATHSLLYSIGINRAKTADCDLNFELKWYAKLAYFIVGTFSLLVIK